MRSSNPGRGKRFLDFKTSRTTLFPPIKISSTTLCAPSLTFNVYKSLSWEKIRRDVQFTTHLHLVLGLRRSEAIPLLLYNFMARRIDLA
jgi:hypothetical protein